MFLAFDTPVPFSTMGRRNVSNVPAQALALWNDPLVLHMAEFWARQVLSGTEPSDEGRIDRLYEVAFSRHPTVEEMRWCLAFLRTDPGTGQAGQPPRAWADLCHVLMNVKDFIYIE